MSTPAVVPKRIIICCDGTWQSSVSGEENIPSNITRLCRHLARTGKDDEGKVWQQIVYYDSGVGTGALTSLEKKRQGATGDGLAVNVIEAYNFIVLNYSPGDEIFCFGFSRGAYTARAVAGLVGDLGVMEPRQMQIFPEIYDIYKKNVPSKENGYVQISFRDSPGWKDLKEKWQRLTSEEKRIIWEFEPQGKIPVSEESRNVKVVGVWDTVGALGVPDGRWTNNSGSRAVYGFHNVKLNKNIENAFQALALDERRKAFSPTLWYIPKDRPQAERTSNLLQVWFPGVHINIGGGSSDTAKGKGDAEQMANITFAWMVECVRPYLAFNETTIAQFLDEYKQLLETINCKNNHHHDPSKQPGLISRAYNGVYNSLPSIFEEPPQAPLAVGWGTADYVDSYQGVMALAGEKRRQPGQCETEVYVENKSMLWKYISGDVLMEAKLLKDLGETNEKVHPVARFRREKLEKGKKDTGGLQGWDYREKAGGKGFEWYKDDLVLDEYVIQSSRGEVGNFPNVERLVASGVADAVEFLKRTDIVNGITRR